MSRETEILESGAMLDVAQMFTFCLATKLLTPEEFSQTSEMAMERLKAQAVPIEVRDKIEGALDTLKEINLKYNEVEK